MAETVTIDGQAYLKRHPLGVLGLSVITVGIYTQEHQNRIWDNASWTPPALPTEDGTLPPMPPSPPPGT